MRIIIPRERLAEAAGIEGYFNGAWPRWSEGYLVPLTWDHFEISWDDWVGVALRLAGPLALLARTKFDCREGDIPLDVPDDPSFLLLP